MPLPAKHGVFSHRLALTEITPSPAFARGAYYVTSIPCQVANTSLPLMVPATSMDAAWAAQPDPFIALVEEVSWQFFLVEGRVPHAPNEMVVSVCQRFLSLIEPCKNQAGMYTSYYAEVRYRVPFPFTL